MIRRVVPFTLLPLTVLATGLAGAPWLRAFPSDVLAAPLFGAAVLSTLVPVVVTALLNRRLWVTALIDVAVFLAFELVVVLHSPVGFGDLVDGLVHGPSELLTFALPLVSPRSLLVAPVALCWLVGAIAGECLARSWSTVLPYGGWLVSFGLAYAGTERAAVSDAHRARVNDTLLAVALLATVLLLRTAQSWVRQDATAEATEAAGILPLRGLIAGIAVTAAAALAAAGAVQAPAFARRPATPQRVPSVNQSRPLTPVSYVSGLRPRTPNDPSQPLFSVTVDHTAPAYFGIANVDFYDGDGWSFVRTFRPSGGVVPADTDPALTGTGRDVTQRYTVDAGPLNNAPWMPSLYRPRKITGTAVNIDAGSGMVVPARPLRAGESYTVRSAAALDNWAQLPATSLPATSAPPVDTQLPGPLRATLGKVVQALADETGVAASSPMPFLQALTRSLQTRYGLSGPRPSSPSVPPSASSSPSPSSPPRASPTGSPTGSPHASAPPARAGGTAFADVLASITGQRAATPEQFATLFVLVARQLGVPARVVTGFRVASSSSAATVAAGTYRITTAQAWTWAEVPVRGSGWVVVDPSPGTYSGAAQQPSVGSEPSPSPTAPPTQNALITSANGGHAVAPKSAVTHHHAASPGPLILLLLCGVGALAVLVLVLLLLRKTRRVRRRRTAPDPRRRLLGAWQESLDLLTESGLPDLSRLTSTEVAAETGARFGPEPAAQAAAIGAAANLAMYSPSTPIAVDDADAAWRSHGALRTLVRRRLSLRARLVARLSYHRSRSNTSMRATARRVRRRAARHGR